MAAIERFFSWYANSILAHATIAVPLVETSVLFLVLTVCLLFRFTKTGLVMAYLFTYRWGLAFCGQNLDMRAEMRTMFLTAYIMFGILVFTFAVIGMLHAARSDT